VRFCRFLFPHEKCERRSTLADFLLSLNTIVLLKTGLVRAAIPRLAVYFANVGFATLQRFITYSPHTSQPVLCRKTTQPQGRHSSSTSLATISPGRSLCRTLENLLRTCNWVCSPTDSDMERTSTFRRVQTYNPFLKREQYDKRSLNVYRALTILSWLMVLALSILNCFGGPWNQATIWQQNRARSTPFSLDPLLTNIYWYAPGTSEIAQTDQSCIGLLS
jgi:hypothetical protein